MYRINNSLYFSMQDLRREAKELSDVLWVHKYNLA